jgi:hypothetical protein
MVYYIYDQEGFVAVLGNAATVTAIWRLLRPLGDASAGFCANGFQNDSVTLLKALEAMDTTHLSADDYHTLERFHKIIQDCAGCAYISDGTGRADDDGEVFDCSPGV